MGLYSVSWRLFLFVGSFLSEFWKNCPVGQIWIKDGLLQISQLASDLALSLAFGQVDSGCALFGLLLLGTWSIWGTQHWADGEYFRCFTLRKHHNFLLLLQSHENCKCKITLVTWRITLFHLEKTSPFQILSSTTATTWTAASFVATNIHCC